MTNRPPPTPDFIDHPWRPLESATLADGFVTLRWPDGLSFRAYSLWLHENAPGIGFDEHIREGLLDPADLPDPDVLIEASVAADGALVLRWTDAAPTRVHPGWLRYVADGRLVADEAIPPHAPWTAAIGEPPTLDGVDILNGEHQQKRWLRHLVRSGVCRLTSTPANEGFLEALIATVGPIRGSNFGSVFHVRSSVTPDSTAYTGLKLGQHTDLPTRESPPGYQFLHCLANTVSGGSSRLTDGLAVAQALADEEPEAYELLTRANWVFMNRAVDAEHRWEGPIIEPPVDGRPLTVRAFYPVRSAPRMPDARIPAAYRALKVFSRYARDARFQITFSFRPGDLLGFDNRRVLHGRDAFDGTQGARFLTGCYVDHDEIYSRLRVLERLDDTP